MIKNLSVFFPAYNEEKNIENTVTKAEQVLKTLKLVAYEIIIINDGSKDNTGKIADELAKNENIKVIHHNPNKGYGEALKSGFYNAKYDWIVFTDSDGQFDFSEVTNFIEKQEESGADLVIGYYKKRQVGFLTKITTKLFWEPVVFILFGFRVKDIDCAFKLISKKVIDTIPRLEATRGAFISSELLVKVKRAGFKIVEIGITHHERKLGWGTSRSLSVIINSYLDLLKLWWKLH